MGDEGGEGLVMGGRGLGGLLLVDILGGLATRGVLRGLGTGGVLRGLGTGAVLGVREVEGGLVVGGDRVVWGLEEGGGEGPRGQRGEGRGTVLIGCMWWCWCRWWCRWTPRRCRRAARPWWRGRGSARARAAGGPRP